MKNSWYLRTQDDTFGPETKERLIEWARMGRIQPGQEISSDGETWLPATEITFLDMRWSIDIGDGQPRGPFNKHAAQALLASGRLPKGSRLIETVPPPESEPPEPPAQPEQAVESEPAVESESAVESEPIAESEPVPDSKQDESAHSALPVSDASAAERDALQKELEEARQALATARAEKRKAEESFATALKEAQTLTGTLADARKETEALKDALAEAQAKAAADVKHVQDELVQTRDQLVRTRDELSAVRSTLTNTQAEQTENENRIQLLSDEIKRLPASAQLAADAQAAVYTLMRDEAEELAATLEIEAKEAEAFRLARQKRMDRLLARRQEILKHIGTDADDMTRRALLAHPEDPRTVHLRQELDALRILQEKTSLESERRMKELNAQLRERETEITRLRRQAADQTALFRQLQETREKLLRREQELVQERQRAEAERQQHETAQQTLLTRLSALELGAPGATHQSREARNVRLAPWMGLKG